ncbi:MAG: 4-hydroxy-tetrahydrodipicolinate reductase [Chloroflexota bacterium]
MPKLKVVVNGAAGKMGQVVMSTLARESDLQVVGGVDIKIPGSTFTLPGNAGTVPLSTNLDSLLNQVKPDVMCDFTVASAVLASARTATKHKVNLVIGTTGLKNEDVTEIGRLAQAAGVGAMVAPNFALGAVLMMHLSKFCAKYFDYAEIIELHHEQKLDAPSGTALVTAREMAKARGKPFLRPAEKESWPSRGELVEGINVHSVRLQGYVAHQEVIFGGLGQTLTIRHDTTGRDSFLPGIMLAVREIPKRKGLVYGLDALLGLS